MQQSAELAAIKSTRARYCVSPGPPVICPGSSVFAVGSRGSTCRSFAVGARLLLRAHARGICLPARIRPSSPARLHLLVYRIALLAANTCLIMDQVRTAGILSLPDVLPESCLLTPVVGRDPIPLQSSQTQIQEYWANFIDPFTAAREDGLRYRAASVRLGPQAFAYSLLNLLGCPVCPSEPSRYV